MIQAHCEPEDTATPVEYIVHRVEGATLDTINYNLLKFIVPSEHIKLSNVFDLLSKAVDKRIILDFSISQVTLEDVSVLIPTYQNRFCRKFFHELGKRATGMIQIKYW